MGSGVCAVLCVNYLERVENYADYVCELRQEEECAAPAEPGP